MDATRRLLETFSGGPLPDWDAFGRRISVTSHETGEAIFHAGDAVGSVFVVRAGLVKLVYLREDGTEWIKSFIGEGGFFASLSALEPGEAAPFSAIAIGKAIVERAPLPELAALAHERIEWSRALVAALTTFASRKEKREREFLTMRAEERYRAFIASHPGLVARIPQRELAAYVGVTPVGLSRIASRVRRRC